MTQRNERPSRRLHNMFRISFPAGDLRAACPVLPLSLSSSIVMLASEWSKTFSLPFFFELDNQLLHQLQDLIRGFFLLGSWRKFAPIRSCGFFIICHWCWFCPLQRELDLNECFKPRSGLIDASVACKPLVVLRPVVPHHSKNLLQLPRNTHIARKHSEQGKRKNWWFVPYNVASHTLLKKVDFYQSAFYPGPRL